MACFLCYNYPMPIRSFQLTINPNYFNFIFTFHIRSFYIQLRGIYLVILDCQIKENPTPLYQHGPVCWSAVSFLTNGIHVLIHSQALADPDKTTWNFCPNIAAAYLFAVLFVLTTGAHLVQAIIYRKGYSWVIITSGLLQIINYVARIVSIKNPNSDAALIVWFIAILVGNPEILHVVWLWMAKSRQIAPLFTNAYVYMVMGRMVYNFIPSTTLAGVKAWRISLYFVLLDFVSVTPTHIKC